MERHALKFFLKKLGWQLEKRGLQIEKDDDKYFVARGFDHTIIFPKFKTEKFIRLLIVEYDSHVVRNIVYRGYFSRMALDKFKKEYNKYLLAKNE